MPNTAYQSGARFERRVKKYLESLGYWVMRSPGSKSSADMVVLGPQTKWLVQCKVNGVCPPAEWNKLWSDAEKAGAVPLIVYREKRKIIWRALRGKKDKRHRYQPWNAVTVNRNEPLRHMSADEYRTIQEWLRGREVEDAVSPLLRATETQERAMPLSESG